MRFVTRGRCRECEFTLAPSHSLTLPGVNRNSSQPDETPSRTPKPIPHGGSGEVGEGTAPLRLRGSQQDSSPRTASGSENVSRLKTDKAFVSGSRDAAAEQVPRPAHPPRGGLRGARDGVSWVLRWRGLEDLCCWDGLQKNPGQIKIERNQDKTLSFNTLCSFFDGLQKRLDTSVM